MERVRQVVCKWMVTLLRFKDPMGAVSDWSKTGMPPLMETESNLYKEE